MLLDPETVITISCFCISCTACLPHTPLKRLTGQQFPWGNLPASLQARPRPVAAPKQAGPPHPRTGWRNPLPPAASPLAPRSRPCSPRQSAILSPHGMLGGVVQGRQTRAACPPRRTALPRKLRGGDIWRRFAVKAMTREGSEMGEGQ